MRRQADRYTMVLEVELFVESVSQVVPLQDLSRSGMFLHLTPPLPVGTPVHVTIAPEGRRVSTTARVTHRLPEAEAHALGRYPGNGIAFDPAVTPGDQIFGLTIERLVRAHRAAPSPAAVRILVADPDLRLLERLSSALSEAGFEVSTASNGMEAMSACLREAPQVILIDRAMPVFDGFRVLDALDRDPRFVPVPAIVTSTDLHDLAPAFAHGAQDFIAKPFTALEVIVRARRLAEAAATAARARLRGNLADLALPALLGLLELERTTGRLTLTGDDLAWIDLVQGRVSGAGASTGCDARTTLMAVLSWTSGSFELTAARPAAETDLALSITHLLLEHARVTDEANAAA